MRTSLFQRGLAPRLVAAALYAVLAGAAVAWLEPSTDSTPPRTPGATVGQTAAVSATVCLDSVLPASAWDVRIDGRVVTPVRADAALWLGEAEIRPDSVLVIDVTPDATTATPAANSLRIRISGTDARDDVAWCDGEWSVVVDLAALARAAAPIDPGDLP